MPPTDLLERASLRLDPVRGRIGAWLARPRAIMVTVALLAATVAGVVGGRAVLDPDPGPAGLQAVLAAASYAGVNVRADGVNGAYVVTGVVRDDADIERVRALVAERAPDTVVELDSTEAMAQAATDLLGQQKISASAKAVRAGVIEVTSEYLPIDRQGELTGYLKRDLPGLSNISFRTQAGRGDAQLKYFFNSPEHGAASFVTGNPGYIVTADGSRWFAGAMLPTGHRIVLIDRNSVTLERGGRAETLVM